MTKWPLERPPSTSSSASASVSSARMSVLGIDISKSFFDVSLIKIGKAGKVSSSVSPLQHRFDNTVAGFKQLGQWLKDCRVKQVHACLEATGRYGDALALWLHTQKHVVSVINPSIIHAYAQVQLRRNKTDAVDADLIARYCLSERPEAWTPPARETLDLQALLKRLDDLKAMRQQELNRLESIVPCQQVAEYIQQHVSFLDNQIHELDVAAKNYTKATPTFAAQLKLLVTIPGIGILTAMRLIAFDLLKFESAGAAVAKVPLRGGMAGLNPSQHTSGTSVERKAHLSKQGHADIRKALYMPALTALTHNPCVRELATRKVALRGAMAAKSKPPMVIVGAAKVALRGAMHKLLRLAYGVLKSNTPFDPNYAIQP